MNTASPFPLFDFGNNNLSTFQDNRSPYKYQWRMFCNCEIPAAPVLYGPASAGETCLITRPPARVQHWECSALGSSALGVYHATLTRRDHLSPIDNWQQLGNGCIDHGGHRQGGGSSLNSAFYDLPVLPLSQTEMYRQNAKQRNALAHSLSIKTSQNDMIWNRSGYKYQKYQHNLTPRT